MTINKNRYKSNHTFEDKKKVEEDYSKKLKEHFKGKGLEVVDLEDHPYFRKKDIDFLLKKGKTTLKVELKADTYYPNNFYVETVSNVTKGTLGCLLYTESDYILYAFINHGIYYMIPTKKFQDWFNKNETRFESPKSIVFTPVGDSGEGYQSKGKLVPVKEMVKELKLKEFKLE